ncbi:MAG: glycosyltransferase family 39 protein [Bacteroidota bacterium]|nr:glycosyltransferase family 39 protein [Bacteroidota bacterium]
MKNDRIFNITLFILFTATIIINLLGMSLIDVMDEDAAQYASISREMADNGNFLKVTHRGIDYLDKPPLLFWLSAIFFKIFGVSHLAYRLPSFLLMILGVYSTFRLGKLLYNRRTGLLAALFFASNQTTFIILQDVRTDTILTALVIFCIWQITEYLRKGNKWAFFLGFIGIGIGMLQKGPIALMIPVLALGADALYHRSWKSIFRWEWLLGLLIIFLVLTPMLLGLYQQHGMLGFRFYFWTQSFGRLTGENTWVDSTSYFFFVHTFIWSFLPWTFLAIYALIRGFRDLFKRKSTEIITLGGFTLAFIAFSMSQYKLPHYLYVVFPLVSILTAHEISRLLNAESAIIRNILFGLQAFTCILLWAGAIMIIIFVFPLQNIILWIIIAVLCISSIYFSVFGKTPFRKIILVSAITILSINFLLDIHFYPNLLKYQSGSQMAHFIHEQDIPLDQFYWYHEHSQAAEFYMKDILPDFDLATYDGSPVYICTIPQWKESLESSDYAVEVIKEFPQYHVTQLSLNFLNKEKRDSTLDRVYLLKVSKSASD